LEGNHKIGSKYIKRGEIIMKLTPPKQITFWIAVILGVLSLLGFAVAALAPFAFWFAFAGLALLIVALLVKGL
jgi:hypothetical protein